MNNAVIRHDGLLTGQVEAVIRKNIIVDMIGGESCAADPRDEVIRPAVQ